MSNYKIYIDTADSSDNIPAAKAIAKGLEDGHTASNPGYWIHLSGTGILTWFDADNERSGEGPLATQIYHDIDDIERLISLPASAFHRDVDIIVQGAISDAVRVAIVCPPTIYDIGSGPISTRSQQVPELVCATLHAGFAPIIGKGLTEWHNINIADIADLYLRLVDATLDPLKNNNPEIFGLRGYFFAENGFHLWADVAQWIADECYRQGYITEAATKAVTQADIDEMEGVGTVSYGCNSKGIAARAKKYLAWEPKGSGLKDTIAELVAKEALLLGVVSKN